MLTSIIKLPPTSPAASSTPTTRYVVPIKISGNSLPTLENITAALLRFEEEIVIRESKQIVTDHKVNVNFPTRTALTYQEMKDAAQGIRIKADHAYATHDWVKAHQWYCEAGAIYRNIPAKRRNKKSDADFLAAVEKGLVNAREKRAQHEFDGITNTTQPDTKQDAKSSTAIDRAEAEFAQSAIYLDAKDFSKAAVSLKQACAIIDAQSPKDVQHYRNLAKYQRKLITVYFHLNAKTEIETSKLSLYETNRQLAVLLDKELLSKEAVHLTASLTNLLSDVENIATNGAAVFQQIKESLAITTQELQNKQEAVTALNQIPDTHKTKTDKFNLQKHAARISILKSTVEGYKLMRSNLQAPDDPEQTASLTKQTESFLALTNIHPGTYEANPYAVMENHKSPDPQKMTVAKFDKKSHATTPTPAALLAASASYPVGNTRRAKSAKKAAEKMLATAAAALTATAAALVKKQIIARI